MLQKINLVEKDSDPHKQIRLIRNWVQESQMTPKSADICVLNSWGVLSIGLEAFFWSIESFTEVWK
jgi:hypothetical protein